MNDFGGMISFTLADDSLDASKKVCESTRFFALAESLGGVESLIEHPALMTHASVPAEQRAELGIDDSLIRLSCGIEDAEDLIADLAQALEA
jgi:cystathionine beta-lyase/cystathionine gamma-synthase